MKKSKVIKVLALLLILVLIVFQAYRVGAATIDEILGEGGETSNLQQEGNTSLNQALNSTSTNETNKQNTTVNKTTNTNKTLPKTGTNENIIIGLMVVCTLAGVYAFKKVKDYNM